MNKKRTAIEKTGKPTPLTIFNHELNSLRHLSTWPKELKSLELFALHHDSLSQALHLSVLTSNPDLPFEAVGI